MILWNVYFPNSPINIERLIYRLDNSITLKITTREKPVERKIVKKTKKGGGNKKDFFKKN